MKKSNWFFLAVRSISICAIFGGAMYGYRYYNQIVNEKAILKLAVERLEASSRVAEVLVVGVNFDEESGVNQTTIKFLEYDVAGQMMEPKYFTFSGNIIQFQSLVIRFEDEFVEMADELRGKSIYLFWKVFMLDGERTQEYEITSINTIPSGYKIPSVDDEFESELWKFFWDYALNPEESKEMGIRNVQIEAPGSMFIPGHIYTIRLEHDGGLIIDAHPVPQILRGEQVI